MANLRKHRVTLSPPTRTTVYVLCLLWATVGVSPFCRADILVDERFVDNPFNRGWQTNNTSRFYWNQADSDLHLELAKWSGDYLYKQIDYHSNIAFIFSFDILLNDIPYSADTAFGLWGTTMQGDSSNFNVGYHVGDSGNFLGLRWTGAAGGSQNTKIAALYPADWETNQWYHNVVEYVPIAGKARLSVTKGKGGVGPLFAEVLIEGIFDNFVLSQEVDRLGTAAIRPGANQEGTADFNIDNVKFVSAPVPEPTSLVAFASLSLMGIGIRWWRQPRRGKP